MVRALVGPVGPVSIGWVAAHLRAGDRAEVWASGRREPLDAIVRSVALSSHVWAGWIDGEPAAVFGVGPASLASGVGVPWLLGAEILDRHPLALMEVSRDWLARVLTIYPHLENHVDARNRRALRWLDWLGFTIHAPEPHGPFGLPFHRFSMGW